MVTIPRPRLFVSILVWVVSFCALLMVWQAPPPSSTSSLLRSSSSSVGSEDANQDFIFHRNHNKLLPRTHVSNLAYLQPKAREKTDSWKEKTDSWKEKTDSWKEKTDSWKEKTDSWRDKTLSLKEKWDANSSPRAKSYPKISFRDAESLMAKALDRDSRDIGPPVSRPITYHRSRIKDATPKSSALSTLLSRDDRREERKLLVHRIQAETQDTTSNIKENEKKDFNENYQISEDSYYNEIEKSTDAKPQDDLNYGPQANLEDDEYYDEEYKDNVDNEAEYTDAEEVDLGGRFNVTPPDSSIVIYNRVPKCASSTMQTILRRLSKHLNFEHVSSLIYDHHQLTRHEQEKLVDNLTTSLEAAPSHALSYDRHLYYTNFTGLGMNPPIYVNIVRDPVERFISSFYYRRSEERLNRIQMHGHPVSPSLSWVNRTVEQCVLLNDPECSFVPGEEKELMLSYFCGHQKFCRIVGNRDAVQMAKHVVSKEYSVVGLVEHMDLSLLLLETLVPRFMEGATEIYGNIRQKEHMVVNINHKKPKVSVAIREELLRRMSDDIDFYYFLEQRLFEQRKYFLSKR